MDAALTGGMQRSLAAMTGLGGDCFCLVGVDAGGGRGYLPLMDRGAARQPPI